MTWAQNYDPLGNAVLSTLAAAIPVAILLLLLAVGHLRVWLAAVLGLAAALGVAIFAYRMPLRAAFGAAAYGAAYGLFPIGWIVVNVMFLHALTVKSGCFEALRSRLATLAPDPRVQLILVAFCFGGFIEGSAGFGAPVAITAAMLMQLGFTPLHASGLSLIANTAPVAFGSVGIPITTLAQVTGLDVLGLSAMAGRQLPPFSLLIPFWVVWAYSGWRGMLGVWPVALAAGGSFAIMQFLVSNFHGPWLVDTIAGLTSIFAVVVTLKFWKPSTVPAVPAAHDAGGGARGFGLWRPWIILAGFLFVWGMPAVRERLDALAAPKIPVPGLHEVVQRVPPVVRTPTAEKAEFRLNVPSATGTGILAAAIVVGFTLRFSVREMASVYWENLKKVRISLLTIAAMLALGNVTKYAGADATLGLALAGTGLWYPFFGTLLGWLGVALTGSDTASNVLFGSLQRITAERLGLSPYLMCAANSTGGVMGKMIDAQSIVVAGVATRGHGDEGRILRYVFFHSLALAAGIAAWITLLARIPALEKWIIK